MKPYVIVHMSTSIDGRTIPSRWRPESANTTPDYDRVHNQLGGDAWLVGRTTGAEFAKHVYRPEASQSFPREPWVARRDAKAMDDDAPISLSTMRSMRFALFFLVVGCACANPSPARLDASSSPTPPAAGDGDDADTAPIPVSIHMRIRVGSAVFPATLQDNEAASAFKAMLPLTLNMTDLNANEKYAELPRSLPVDASNPRTIHAGDVMLYGSNTIVLFYETFTTSYSYTRIGKLDDVSGLAAALGSGSIAVTFEL